VKNPKGENILRRISTLPPDRSNLNQPDLNWNHNWPAVLAQTLM